QNANPPRPHPLSQHSARPRNPGAAKERDELSSLQSTEMHRCPSQRLCGSIPHRRRSSQRFAALRDCRPVHVGLGSDSVIRRCWFNVRFARERTRLKVRSTSFCPQPYVPCAPISPPMIPLALLQEQAWARPITV